MLWRVLSHEGTSKPHVHKNPQAFHVQVGMPLTVRGGGAICVVSHLIRSLIWREHFDWKGVQSELLAFRSEIFRSEQLLVQANTALDSCLVINNIQSGVIRALAALVGQIVVLGLVWYYCFWKRSANTSPSVASSSDSEDSDSPSEPDLGKVTGDKQKISLTAPKGEVRKGPLRPSDLRKLASDGSRS